MGRPPMAGWYCCCPPVPARDTNEAVLGGWRRERLVGLLRLPGGLSVERIQSGGGQTIRTPVEITRLMASAYVCCST